ncbi:hypothetical protein [Vogesella sp. LIG4]|uniref:hypothetical protein n=1 Tax=Vogesella sp. LIG4 TaxID=1192162 RepID=UPI0012FE722E|nr:hypothetical protein [Vogesella sp. LIG4]
MQIKIAEKSKKFIAAMTFILITPTANSGIRESFYILTYPLNKNSEEALEKPLDRFFNKKLNEKLYRCSAKNDFPEELAFERVFTKRKPPSLEKSDVEKAISGEKASITKLQNLIKSYHDEKAPHGFDIFITYAIKNKKVMFYLTAPDTNGFSIITTNSTNESAIANTLCPAIKNIGFSPYIEP